MDSKTKGVNSNLAGVLDSLDQPPLDDNEAEQALQDQIEKFAEPSFEYDEEIDFENIADITKDFQIARRMIMETIDKSKKISDAVINTLVVDTANPTFLQLAQEANRTIQQSVKSLSDIHSSHAKIHQQHIRNKLSKSDDEEESDEDESPKKRKMTFEE